MVQKTLRRGVQTGNTVRYVNPRYMKRYKKEAYIVSRVQPELLKKLTDAAEADDEKSEMDSHNAPVNVALSLNKQARWLLPGRLIDQIEDDDFEQSELTICLLERHKLQRASHCVGFYSNKGSVKRIKTSSYFSFQFPNVNGKSRRALRRERRQEQLRMWKENRPEKIVGKTIEVFTEQGNHKRNVEMGESEVRYEVHYPASSQSFVSHNRKFMGRNVYVPTENDEEQVLQSGLKKQRHRKQKKKMSLKNFDYTDPLFYRYDQSLTTVTDTSDHEESPSLGDTEEEHTTCTTEYLFSTLVEKARQQQSFKALTKSRHGKSRGKTSPQHEREKSHVVFVSESWEHEPELSEEPFPVMPPVSPTPSEMSIVLPPSPVMPPGSTVPSESTRVMLPKDDVTVASLKDRFGQNYFEASCRPRKFVLDITLNIRALLKKQGIQAKVADRTDDALSYLVCIHDGFYDDEYDVYKVLLNSKLHQGLLAVEINTEKHQGMYKGTLMDLINQTMGFVKSLVINCKDKNHFPLFLTKTIPRSSSRHLNTHLGSSEAYVPSLERLFHLGSTVYDIWIPTLSYMLQEDSVFCNVCYDNVSPLVKNSAPFTSLLKCKHYVCDSCWSQHIHTRIHEGFGRLTCPGYDCQEEVKVGVLLSLVSLDTAEKLLQRQEDIRVSASPTDIWCPNESCGRVICLQSSPSSKQPHHQQDVVCACGIHVCFLCLMPAHWPASCKQAEEYRANLATVVFPDRQAEVYDDSKFDKEAKLRRQQEDKETMVVEGKHCPRCKSFVVKNGGCPQMTCRCGQLFCWFCAKPGFSHPTRMGCVNEKEEKNLTTTVLVRHVEDNKSLNDTKPKKQSFSVSRRQRVSLMERAVEHRQHHQNKEQNVHIIIALVKSVAAAAIKNKDLTQKIIKVCSETFPLSSTNSNPNFSTGSVTSKSNSPTSVSVTEIVTAFLKNADRSKQELHEVVEYSFVLLKDLPDSLPRRRALRISEDLGAYCSFSQSIFDAWSNMNSSQCHQKEAVKAVVRLAEIQGWMQSALDSHVVTIRKIRSLKLSRV